MGFAIAWAEGFPSDYTRCPKQVQKSLMRLSKEILQSSPTDHTQSQIKKLDGYKELWRLRVGKDHRVIYRVDAATKTVILLMADHRTVIYERSGISESEFAVPSLRIVANAPELLETEPAPELVVEADLTEALSSASGDDLPQRLTSALLKDWGVPARHHDALTRVRTGSELLGLEGQIPTEVLEQVLKGLYPPPIEKVVNTAVRVSDGESALDDVASGRRSLLSFLLRLDEEQANYVSRFERGGGAGPWLVKGGPGSGKSTVALYCVREIFDPKAPRLDAKNPKVLFTTYTKSLTAAAEHLLSSLGVSSADLDIMNVDKLTWKFLSKETRDTDVEKNFEGFVKGILARGGAAYGNFTAQDARFLASEIEWMIIGQGLSSLKAYKEADRSGRGRILGVRQREAVWKLHEAAVAELARRGKSIFAQWRLEALGSAVPRYDYVFIDEAQDLQPVAIRLLIKLCKNPKNIFLTADNNQSIYGNGVSWTSVAADLKVQGRSRILRRNYRTTAEIWNAIRQLAPEGSGGRDDETLDVETPYSGESPVLRSYASLESAGPELAEWITGAVLQEGFTLGSAAVLCPSHDVARIVHKALDRHVQTAPLVRGGFNPEAPGIKVMTIHSSKGLEFPVVAVVGLQRDLIPMASPSIADREEHMARQRRLLFVACSRASRRLAVIGSYTEPSEFLPLFDESLWEIDERLSGEGGGERTDAPF